MRRMFSKEQLIKLIQDNSLSQEEVVELLVGKYVRIMEAPESTTLTDEQIAQIEEGVFINGTFLGFKNPVLCPCELYGSTYYGLIFSGGRTPNIRVYAINSATKVISLALESSNDYIRLSGVASLNNKTIPAYPSDTGTFTLKCVDGVLTWVEDE